MPRTDTCQPSRRFGRNAAFAALLVVTLACGLTWLIVSRHNPPEPVYQGRRLREWLRHKPDGTRVYDGAVQAIREIGTNAIPTLLQLLQAHDSPLKLKIMGMVQKQHFVHINWVSAEEQYFDASEGFSTLGKAASNAVPGLIEVYKQRISESSQQRVAEALMIIGPAADVAVPELIKTTTNSNASAGSRVAAIFALGSIGSRPKLVVPTLIQCLNDGDSAIRLFAAQTLIFYADDAESALPALFSLMKDTNAYVVINAGNAIGEIDPDAANKAGIKPQWSGAIGGGVPESFPAKGRKDVKELK